MDLEDSDWVVAKVGTASSVGTTVASVGDVMSLARKWYMIRWLLVFLLEKLWLYIRDSMSVLCWKVVSSTG